MSPFYVYTKVTKTIRIDTEILAAQPHDRYHLCGMNGSGIKHTSVMSKFTIILNGGSPVCKIVKDLKPLFRRPLAGLIDEGSLISVICRRFGW